MFNLGQVLVDLRTGVLHRYLGDYYIGRVRRKLCLLTRDQDGYLASADDINHFEHLTLEGRPWIDQIPYQEILDPKVFQVDPRIRKPRGIKIPPHKGGTPETLEERSVRSRVISLGFLDEELQEIHVRLEKVTETYRDLARRSHS